MAGEAAVDAWLAALQLIMLSTRSTAVIVGATGGVRLALERGQLTNDMLAAFAARVEKLGGARCQFLLLSGEDEAAACPATNHRHGAWPMPCQLLTPLLTPGPLFSRGTRGL